MSLPYLALSISRTSGMHEEPPTRSMLSMVSMGYEVFSRSSSIRSMVRCTRGRIISSNLLRVRVTSMSMGLPSSSSSSSYISIETDSFWLSVFFALSISFLKSPWKRYLSLGESESMILCRSALFAFPASDSTYSETRRSMSSPPSQRSPPVPDSMKFPPDATRMERSNVPPPKSYTRKILSSSAASLSAP